MTPREIVLAQVRHEETETVPYTLTFEGDVPDQLDQHFGSADWRARIRPYVAWCGGIDRRGTKPLAPGREIDRYGSVWRTDRRPFHLEKPALATPSLDGYDMPRGADFAGPDMKHHALDALRAHPDLFSIFGVGWGMWECCWGMRGFENALVDAVAEPEFVEDLLDRLTEVYLEQIALCADIPTDAVMFGDDWGDQRGIMIGPERWRRFFKPRYARIYEAVHAQGKITISHCCGSAVDIIPDLVEIGLDVLESVQPEARGMNPYDLKQVWGDKITFWGGLGSQSTIAFGTPESIRAEVAQLKREMGKGGGYILAPAKPLQPGTPPANAAAVVEAFTE